VLILADPNDIHARAVAAEVGIAFGGSPIILNTQDFPNRWHLTSAIDAASGCSWLVHLEHSKTQSDQVSGVWRRRTAPHEIHSDIRDRQARRFSLNDVTSAFQGWLHSLGTAVINPLGAEFAASRKVFQLAKAQEVGLRFPDTIVTSDPQEARRFLERMSGQAVFKVLEGVREVITETRRFRKAHARNLDALRYAPVIFQELIEAELDIRVTIIDKAVFSVSIRPTNAKARLDWRLDPAAEIKPHNLPLDVERKLIELLRTLNLRFGALDLRLTRRGEYVFLEVNPSGQFLFCEIHGNRPISRAVAAALLGRDAVTA
jgi:glutathione synthase/RimK-type ligase-like ATP-grasp enzyme